MLIGLASLMAKPPKRFLSSAHCLDFNVTVTKKINKTFISAYIRVNNPNWSAGCNSFGSVYKRCSGFELGTPRKQLQPAIIAHFVPVEAVKKYEKKNHNLINVKKWTAHFPANYRIIERGGREGEGLFRSSLQVK